MNQIDPGYTGYDDPRLQPPEEADDPVDLMEECDHMEACVRALGLLWYGGVIIDRDSMFWMDDAARRLECARCKVRGWE